ncbi:MAG: succinate dehydrogenase membrane anchor subunit [Halothiobacillaceae bacterium]|nr:MAG: succinate dehydrogenase membrane anchor subunit [Halothiobacillaceae bacterium]
MKWQAEGFRAWLLQRLSAFYMLLFIVWFLVALPLYAPANFFEWRAWVGGMPTAIATSLFFVALLLHLWIGLRDVVIDYVRPFAVRFALLVVIALALVLMALWILRVLFRATL